MIDDCKADVCVVDGFKASGSRVVGCEFDGFKEFGCRVDGCKLDGCRASGSRVDDCKVDFSELFSGFSPVSESVNKWPCSNKNKSKLENPAL